MDPLMKHEEQPCSFCEAVSPVRLVRILIETARFRTPLISCNSCKELENNLKYFELEALKDKRFISGDFFDKKDLDVYSK